MRITLLILSFIFSLSSYAAHKPIYKIKYQILEKEKVINSAAIMIEEGRVGKIESIGSGNNSEMFDAKVKTSKEKETLLDYRFKKIINGQTIELKKVRQALVLGQPIFDKYENAQGHSFQLQIIVEK